MNRKDIRKDLISTFHKLGYKHSLHTVFEDFVTLYAIAISNSCDGYHYEEREKEYLRIIKKYNKEEVDQLVRLCAVLTAELEMNKDNPVDVLGPVFHELELHNKYKGQFFTPQSISDMMAQLTMNPDDLKDGKHITANEPTSGSGANILAVAGAIAKHGGNYQTQLVVVAQDIDFKCVAMTYIQLALHGIPAVVIHGNTLTLEEQSRWYTPMYFMGNWFWREPDLGMATGRKPEVEAFRMASDPMYAAIRKMGAAV